MALSSDDDIFAEFDDYLETQVIADPVVPKPVPHKKPELLSLFRLSDTEKVAAKRQQSDDDELVWRDRLYESNELPARKLIEPLDDKEQQIRIDEQIRAAALGNQSSFNGTTVLSMLMSQHWDVDGVMMIDDTLLKNLVEHPKLPLILVVYKPVAEKFLLQMDQNLALLLLDPATWPKQRLRLVDKLKELFITREQPLLVFPQAQVMRRIERRIFYFLLGLYLASFDSLNTVSETLVANNPEKKVVVTGFNEAGRLKEFRDTKFNGNLVVRFATAAQYAKRISDLKNKVVAPLEKLFKIEKEGKPFKRAREAVKINKYIWSGYKSQD
ncbi:hypothetical protein RI367_008819 [Sorochytrium milnesiophthora]